MIVTIITLKDGDGKVRRCDARCYNARGKKCTCACRGLNHGMGLAKAIHQSCDWLNPNALDYPGTAYQIAGPLQLPLIGQRPGHRTNQVHQQGDHPPNPLQGE